MCPLHPEPHLSPASPPHSSRQSQRTGFGCRVIHQIQTHYFTYGNVYVSVLFSQITPQSSFPTESKSLFFLSVSRQLLCMQDYQYHLSRFHIYVLLYDICLSLSELLHCIIVSRFIHLTRTDANAFLLQLSNIPLCICTTTSLSIHLTFRLLPGSSYCKQCCREHGYMCLFQFWFPQGKCPVVGLQFYSQSF